MTQARGRLAIAALLLLGAGVGSGLAALVSHNMQLAAGKENLRQYAGHLLRNMRAVSNEVGNARDAVLAANLPFCSDQELALMRRIVFSSTNIKDLGRVKDGSLYCTTSIGRLASPLHMATPDVDDNGIRFYSLTPLAMAPGANGQVTEQSGVSFAFNPQGYYSLFDKPPLLSTGLFYAKTTRRAYYAIGHSEPLTSDEVVAQRMVVRDGAVYQPLCSVKDRVCIVGAEPLSDMMKISTLQAAVPLAGGATLGSCVALTFILLYNRRRSLERRLRRAVRRGDLTVAYQPVIDLSTRAVVGAEALVRWTNESNEEVPTEAFIELAERKGFICDITRQVLNRVVEEMKDLLRRGDFHVIVNITMQDLQSPAFFEHLQRCTEVARIEPSALGLEITERSTADQAAATLAIARLKSIGHAVLIDDFGTGYSSLAYLHQLSVDGIKIDRAFTATVGTDAVTASVVPQILDMASKLDLLVIVEGIETEQQAAYFRNNGRGIQGQGWLFGKPLPAPHFKSYFDDAATKSATSAYPVSQPV